MSGRGFVLGSCLLAAGPAAAADAKDAVRPFYERPGLELEPSERRRFIDPARTVLDQNDVIRQGGDEGCLDPALPFDDTDYDPKQVLDTLQLSEVATGEEATVVATFMAGTEAHRVQWRLKKVGVEWKIFDFASMSKDWALSRFQCE